jgi:hypothetical protein
LECLQQTCPSCGGALWNKYDNYRTVITLKQVVQLRLKIRRCPNRECERFQKAYRPEQEKQWALPQHEFGLDVIVLVGAMRYQGIAVFRRFMRLYNNEDYASVNVRSVIY